MNQTKMEVFTSSEFGQVRIFEEGNHYLFCGADVANALGYKNPRAALTRHCKGVTKRDTLTPGGVQQLVFISEGDVYRLIVHSQLPSAERFEKWVFEEVLPTIRKYGGYMTDSLLDQITQKPDSIYHLAQALLEERELREETQQKLMIAQPKAEFYDFFVAHHTNTNIRTTAKELNVPEKRFVKFLLETGFLYRAPSGVLLPYADALNRKLFTVKDYVSPVNGHFGVHTLFTPQGKDFFRQLIKEIKADEGE